MPEVRLMLGDCLERMAEIEDGSVDAIITDPIYPEIDRKYGRITEAEWHVLMRGVVAESRRVLKLSGSAVFILQPNSRKVGSMRPWLWEFMAWTCREWNMVQDAWWWRFDTMPTEGAPTKGLMRQSLKACVWLGPPDCFRDQDAVLWTESDGNKAARLAGRCGQSTSVSRWRPGTTPRVNDVKRCRTAAERRGGVTPFNVLPISAGGIDKSNGHPARTPLALADWWTRYICPDGGTICDPFAGSGTMGLAALARGRSFIGIERDEGYFATASARIEAAQREQTEMLALG